MTKLVLKPPADGHKVIISGSQLKVPDDPIIPIIEGDGIGPDVTRAARRAISAAVEQAYGGGPRDGGGTGAAGGGMDGQKGSPEAKKLLEILARDFNVRLPEDSGLGLKPISEFKSKRLVRKAIRYAIDPGRRAVAPVPKGNIMKYTEGGFPGGGSEV